MEGTVEQTRLHPWHGPENAQVSSRRLRTDVTPSSARDQCSTAVSTRGGCGGEATVLLEIESVHASMARPRSTTRPTASRDTDLKMSVDRAVSTRSPLQHDPSWATGLNPKVWVDTIIS